MLTGRPTDYNDEVLVKTQVYLDECVENNSLPSIARLSRYLRVARSSIYLWKEKNKDFSDILEDILSEQEAKALEKGLNGDWNATIVKLLLGKHGYSEKHQQEHSGAVEIKQVERVIVDK